MADPTGQLPVPRSKDKVIKAKLGLLEQAKKLGKFLQVCRVLGDNCDSFYRLRDLSVRGSAQAVAAISKAEPNLKRDPVVSEMEMDVVAIATILPA